MMKAGELRWRITLQRQTVTQSDSGQETITWSDIATVWAKKIEMRGFERFAARQVTGNAIRTFEIRWSATTAGLTVLDQLISRGLAYNITDVREIGYREGIQIDCFTASEEAAA